MAYGYAPNSLPLIPPAIPANSPVLPTGVPGVPPDMQAAPPVLPAPPTPVATPAPVPALPATAYGSAPSPVTTPVSAAPPPQVSRCGPLKPYGPEIARLLLAMARRDQWEVPLRAGCFWVLDLETTGRDPASAVIWQIGAVEFQNFQPARTLNRVLRIARPDFDQAFADEADRPAVYAKMHLSWERIEAEGVAPEQAATELADLAQACQALPLLGYNVHSFDCRFLQVFYRIYRPERLAELQLERALDLGAPVKAAQIDFPILDLETSREFTRRVHAQRSKAIYWSIEYVTTQLELLADATALHDAVQDCREVGRIVEYLLRMV